MVMFSSLLNIFYILCSSLPGAQLVQLYQGGWGLCFSWACEALFQTDPGVQTPVHDSYKPRRQATGRSAFLSYRFSVSSHFQTWPPGAIRRIGYGVYSVCLSHMHNTAGGFLHRRVQNSIKSSTLVRREVEQPSAAYRGRKWRINLAVEIMFTAPWISLDIIGGHLI